MKFRKERFDKVIILNQPSSDRLTQNIEALAKVYTLIDLQYAVNRGFNQTWYSALALVRLPKKRVVK